MRLRGFGADREEGVLQVHSEWFYPLVLSHWLELRYEILGILRNECVDQKGLSVSPSTSQARIHLFSSNLAVRAQGR